MPQPHIVARAHNLEWVFDKIATDLPERAARAAELAETVQSLPRPWPGDSPAHASDALKRWLAIPTQTAWGDAAWEAVARCHPPIHEFAEHTHGIGVLRWALHRVWPYPSFLIDDAHLAARLHVGLVSLREQLETSEALKTLLQSVLYRGPLESFVGRRWWRAGIESLIFDLAPKDPASITVLHARLSELAPALTPSGVGTTFPVIDECFNVKSELGTADQVVEIKAVLKNMERGSRSVRTSHANRLG